MTTGTSTTTAVADVDWDTVFKTVPVDVIAVDNSELINKLRADIEKHTRFEKLSAEKRLAMQKQIEVLQGKKVKSKSNIGPDFQFNWNLVGKFLLFGVIGLLALVAAIGLTTLLSIWLDPTATNGGLSVFHGCVKVFAFGLVLVAGVFAAVKANERLNKGKDE